MHWSQTESSKWSLNSLSSHLRHPFKRHQGVHIPAHTLTRYSNLEPDEKAGSHRTAAGVLRRCRPGVLKSHPFFGTGAWAHPGARAGQTYRAAQTLESGSPDSHAGMRGARSRHPSDVGGRPTRGCGRGHGRCQSRSRACPHARRRTRRPLMKERSDIYLAPRWSGIGH